MDKRELTRWAAMLEYRQAEREYSEAYAALMAHRAMGSGEDYAMWSAAAYADSAKRAIPRKFTPGAAAYINMNDGVKGKRTTANGSVYRKGAYS